MKRVAKSVVMATSSAAFLLAGAGMASATGHSGASAEGVAANSPGVLSGNLVQIPVHVPVNLCGNTINVIGLLNPAFGNTCVNA
ncbi:MULTISPECIES: chaplin [unclassified Streptomyces]|uniref:chaplin n=1 Tax=unclassified Streptomyces TaxID=2593676 RepID=UPI0036675BD0